MPKVNDQVKAEQNLGVPSAESAIIPELDAAPSFTPGPWAVADSFYDRGEGDGGPRWDVHVPNAQTVADVRREADARLIAAAPELYAALRRMLADVEAYQSNPYGHAPTSCVAEARAALAKVNATERETETRT